MTHGVSGVAEDLPSLLVDCNIWHSGEVTPQGGYRMCGDKWTPQPDCSITASGNHQLQSCAVVKAFNSLEWDKKKAEQSAAVPISKSLLWVGLWF